MRKNWNLLALLLIVSVIATSCAQRNFSQRRYTKKDRIFKEDIEFMHAVGGQFNMGINQNFEYGYPVGGIFYHPRLNLARPSTQFAFSLDMPITIGISHGTDFRYYLNPLTVPAPKIGLTFEIPVALGFNFGFGSTRTSSGAFGAFLTTGYSFAHLPTGVTREDALPIGHGPRGQFGFRFKTGVLSWQFSGNFMFNIYQRSHIAGFGLGLTLGSWNHY